MKRQGDKNRGAQPPAFVELAPAGVYFYPSSEDAMIDHLRNGNGDLSKLLYMNKVVVHPFIIGELPEAVIADLIDESCNDHSGQVPCISRADIRLASLISVSSAMPVSLLSRT